MQHQGFNRVVQPRNLAPGQGGLRFGQGINLLAREPRLARTQAGRCAVQRNVELCRAHARAHHLGLVVRSQHALRLAIQRLHAVRLQVRLQPVALLLHAGNTQTAHILTQPRQSRRWALATAQPGIPRLMQGIVLETGQLCPAHRQPAAFGTKAGGPQGGGIDHLAGRKACAGAVAGSPRGAGHTWARRAGSEGAYNQRHRNTKQERYGHGPDFA